MAGGGWWGGRVTGSVAGVESCLQVERFVRIYWQPAGCGVGFDRDGRAVEDLRKGSSGIRKLDSVDRVAAEDRRTDGCNSGWTDGWID